MAHRVYLVDEADSRVSPEAVTQLVQAVLKAEEVEGTLGVVLVNEDTIAHLNRRYRDAEGATDVLSFAEANDDKEWPVPECCSRADPDLPGCSAEPRALGEVVVCPAVVYRYSAEEGCAEEHMLAWAVIHGVLHLLGYDHEVDEGEMREREELILGICAGTVARLQRVDRLGECGRTRGSCDEPRAS